MASLSGLCPRMAGLNMETYSRRLDRIFFFLQTDFLIRQSVEEICLYVLHSNHPSLIVCHV